jgi:pyrroline-5-carboxylate reductase
LTFAADQAVISVMAGASVQKLRTLVAPAVDISRVIPLPSLPLRPGVTPVHPAGGSAAALFGRLGGAADVEDLDAFEAMSTATATIAAHLQYLATISGWLSEHGVASEQAARYVAAIFAGVTERLGGDTDLDRLARAYATPGGNNERFAARLSDGGTFDLVRRSLDAVYRDIRTGD